MKQEIMKRRNAARRLLLLAAGMVVFDTRLSAGTNPDATQGFVEGAISAVNPALVRIQVVTTDYYRVLRF